MVTGAAVFCVSFVFKQVTGKLIYTHAFDSFVMFC